MHIFASAAAAGPLVVASPVWPGWLESSGDHVLCVGDPVACCDLTDFRTEVDLMAARQRRQCIANHGTSVLVLGLALLLGGCGTTASTAGATVGVHDSASLMARLQAAGMSVVIGGVVHHPFLSVAGQVLLVNNQAVEAFHYPSADALLADTADITADGCIGTIGGGEENPWSGPPHLFKSAGLLVIYIGSDALILHALTSVLGLQFKGQ